MFALRSKTQCASSSTSVHRYPDLQNTLGVKTILLPKLTAWT